MNLSDLLRFLQPGDPEAAAYLNDPNSRPEIGRSRPLNHRRKTLTPE